MRCCSVCNMKTRKVVQFLKCHSSAVTACCIDTRSGRFVTSCEAEGTTQFWDVSQLLNTVLQSTRATLATTRLPAEKCAPLEDIPVLTECCSPTEECGPIPSSFSPSALHKPRKASQQGVMPTAASMPVWKTATRRQHSLHCDMGERGRPIDEEGMSAPVPLGADSCRMSMSELRTSVCRQELQRKRAQEHAGWMRSNLDHLNAMQNELQVCIVAVWLTDNSDSVCSPCSFLLHASQECEFTSSKYDCWISMIDVLCMRMRCIYLFVLPSNSQL